MKTFIVCFVLLFLILSGNGLGQNLVPNPGFENMRNKRHSMTPWQMVNTIDYFIYDEAKKDQKLKTKIKDKNFKLRPARTGVAYVGLRVWPRYSEFLIVELLHNLEAGQQYYFEMYMCISAHANAYLRSIGVSFYSFRPPYSQKNGIYDFPAHIDIYKYQGIIDTTDWVKIAGVFTATGDERFMSIGNFSRNNRDKFKRRKFGISKREAYYYIDDVALYKLDEFGYPIISTSNPLVSNDSLNDNLYDNPALKEIDDYYRTISFPPGSSDLTYEAYQKLGFIVEYLTQHTDVSIHIIGQSGQIDNQDVNEQIKIAQKRARNTGMFLTGNRINKNRLTFAYSVSENKDENITIQHNSTEILFSNDPGDQKKIKARKFRIIE